MSEWKKEKSDSFLLKMADKVALKSGRQFYNALVEFVATELHVSYVLIGELRKKTVKTVAFWMNGALSDSITYELEGTPCDNVLSKKDCFYDCNVQQIFPTDLSLVTLQAESYSGIPIIDHNGKALGIISIMDTKKLNTEEDSKFRAILKFFSGRVAFEMERERNENIIKASLREKDLLLSEIHHRVKNNLALIISLLQLQHDKEQNNNAKAVLINASNRIRSISLLYDRIYQTHGSVDLSVKNYISDLIPSIIQSISKDVDIAYSIQCEEIETDMDSLISIGLLLNELVTNSVKYAFKTTKKPQIDVSYLISAPGEITLSVKDNGSGIKDIQEEKGLGSILIHNLALQLRGKLTQKNLFPGYETKIQIQFDEFTQYEKKNSNC